MAKGIGVPGEDKLSEMQVIAIVRFGKRTHLDKLLHGEVRWVPPEYYRMKYEHPSGDLDESCSMSYRRERKAWSPVLEVDGHRIPAEDMIALTLRGEGKADRYLHCWSAIDLPEDEEQLSSMKANLRQLQDEFGPDYILIPHTSVDEYRARLVSSAPGELDSGIVRYTDSREFWGPTCKAEKFSYQRELRFVAGECTERDETPIIADVGDLTDLMILNAPLEMKYEGKTILRLSRDGVE